MPFILEISDERKAELEDDEEFKAIRHRFYKLGKAKGREILVRISAGQLPQDVFLALEGKVQVPPKVLHGTEKLILFSIVEAGKLPVLCALIGEAEAEILTQTEKGGEKLMEAKTGDIVYYETSEGPRPCIVTDVNDASCIDGTVFLSFSDPRGLIKDGIYDGRGIVFVQNVLPGETAGTWRPR